MPPRPSNQKISEILEELSRHLDQPQLSLGELQQKFSGRFYGLLMFILALPNLVPVPAPGLSAIMGVPLILLTFQQAIGLENPWFPRRLRERRIKTQTLQHICTRAVPYVRAAEKIVKPRLLILVRPPAQQCIAAICLLLSFTIAMPIPFGNALPALAICLFAIAMLQRDGLFVLLALVVGMGAVSIIAAALSAGIGVMQAWAGIAAG